MVTDNNKLPPPQEMETFLPSDGTKKKGIITNEYRIANDVEFGGFDPFAERKVDHPTSDCDTVTHLLKASLGTGILAMPVAFNNVGLAMGVFFTILVAVVCTHCAYILVKCAHHLYKKTRVTQMNFADVSVCAFQNGPAWARKFAYPSKFLILFCLFLTYFGTCSVYTVIIAKNFEKVIEHHTEQDFDGRIIIAAFLIPLVLLSFIPNLKYLAPVSMVANIFMGLGLGITMYYLGRDMPYPINVPLVQPLWTWPEFFSITIFAMEAIGVVMPLENHMKTPQNFLGICGVLNRGMSGVTLIYILLGVMGFMCYGDKVQGAITLNLPVEEIPAQIVMILISIAVYCTYGLQFYVCLEICWDAVKDRIKRMKLLCNYLMRTFLVVLSVVLAIAVPTISPFIGLIGAFCFSILGLIIPVFIEMITFWDVGFGKFNWIVWKNVLVLTFGIFALIFGTKDALKAIIDLYK